MDKGIPYVLHSAVRKYIVAEMISRAITRAEISSSNSPLDDIEFGEVSAAQVKAEHRRKKQRSKKRTVEIKYPDSLIGSLHERELSFTAAQRQRLREQALAAMATASELAGEPVKYCCAAIRPESFRCLVNDEHNEVYRDFNELFSRARAVDE